MMEQKMEKALVGEEEGVCVRCPPSQASGK